MGHPVNLACKLSGINEALVHSKPSAQLLVQCECHANAIQQGCSVHPELRLRIEPETQKEELSSALQAPDFIKLDPA